MHHPVAAARTVSRPRTSVAVSLATQCAPTQVNLASEAPTLDSLDSHKAVIGQHVNDDRQCRLRVDPHTEIEAAVLASHQRVRYHHVTSIGDEGDGNCPDNRMARTRCPRHVCALSTIRKDKDGVLDALQPG